ncbi:uncharacterized protein LOC128418413 isoform X2 [Podarcis raffonei]|uniref:uncharacterized protein LOC128418413 isoform X2 n=1 Tax=Podarcis raffonei TaxID=65483 RepID=UPI00232987FD|nr:uncharacterized protein LOC128418413 isoform X2 [Podarcis raffonei]
MACKSSKQDTLVQMKQPSGKRTLDIAIVGDSGVGKSSLINALRNMADDELGAAAVDVMKGTREPAGYLYPQYPDVTLWDLPGIQPPLFPAERYIKDMDFKKYDFFILVGERRLTDDVIVLARKIQKRNKGFFYVCTKVDVIIFAESRKPSFNEEKTLEQIRKDCCECLTKAGESPPRVFLISRWDLSMYDFPLLQRTLQDECIDLQRRALLPPQDPGRKTHNKPDECPGGAAVGANSSRSDTSAQREHPPGKSSLDVAITGGPGVGKSSLVNALRKMADNEEDAAVVDMIQGTKELKGYLCPSYPDVTLWDLPAIGTHEFEAEKYVKEMDFNKYDFFIIVSEISFTEHDAMLAREIWKRKKRFLYVRTKVDVSIADEKRNPHFTEEKTLKEIRNYYCENLAKAGESFPRVFLISNWDLSMYDFPLLQRTLQDEFIDLKRSSDSSRKATWRDIKKHFIADLENMKAVLLQGHLSDVVAQIQQELDLLSNATLDIAITGRTGTGKSSLVNALRGMTDFEEGSAKTGVRQTTMFPTKYQHPNFPKVTLWDLPGIGTDEFKADEYLEKVDFSKYDFFIIASERFTESDTQLAREIQKMKKKFYYVHPKINLSMAAERRKPNFNEMETLGDLRQDCCDKLRKLGEASPKVFLISNWDLSMYDFPILQETLQNELDHLKRHALLLSMPTFSRDILEKKKSEMRKLIWKQALVSYYFGCVTRLALKLPWHISFLVTTLKKFCMAFGLDEESLCSLANRVGKRPSELKSVIKKSPLANEISEEFVLDLLAKSGQCKALTVLEQIVEFIPVLGNLVSGTISFKTIYHMLQCFLQDVEEDAENVRSKASER